MVQPLVSFDDLEEGSDANEAQDAKPLVSFDDLEEPKSLGAFGTMRDIGRGVIAAPITLAQGIAELGALGADLAFDTDYARGTTEFFEGVKDTLGATPEGTAGQVTDELLAFGLGFIPVAGWLGRASAVARGTTMSAAAPKSLFMKTATSFGNSARGKALLGTRARLAATTAVAAGGYEAITSPDGYGTVADAFDSLPEFMRSEQASDDITGRGRCVASVAQPLATWW
jgi:hypothetical protein